jgi:hypothetical protein
VVWHTTCCHAGPAVNGTVVPLGESRSLRDLAARSTTVLGMVETTLQTHVLLSPGPALECLCCH